MGQRDYRYPLHLLLLVSSLSLMAGDGAAYAQSGPHRGSVTTSAAVPTPPRPTGQAETDPAQRYVQQHSVEYLDDCMKRWDKRTNMTKEKWSRSCRRVVDEHMKFRVNNKMRLP
jgi:hypothetical protein